jgi:FAD/FMN-containing dehydrogenase
MKRRAFVRSGMGIAMGSVIPGVPRFLRVGWRDLPDVEAVTGDGKPVTLRGAAMEALAARMRGRILLANDDGYDQARRILNASFDKHPALIARVTGTVDVQRAVEFAREHELLLAVKCGGHSTSGKSTCDRGMMIDLSLFRSVRVDPAARTARVTGGSLLGQLDHESMAYGLVTPMGTVSHTGVGGLVTGGGFGRLARRFGMSIDNLLSVDVVTADGRLVRASAEEHPELFWGVRGGGGNFGIVTSFEFRLHPMQREVVGGNIMFPIARARDVLEVYADYIRDAPDELSLGFGVAYPPRGAPGVAGFSVCYSGPAGEAERVLAPIRKLGSPLVDGVRAVDYVALQRSGDIDDPRARATYLKSGFLPDFPAALASSIVDHIEGHPGRSTAVFYQESGGAISRVANGDTAFAHRDAKGNLLSAVDWAAGDDPREHIAWLRTFWGRLEPLTRGFYTNDLEAEAGAPQINENYRGNYERLVRVKRTYDPTNLFRLNANIEPRRG